MADNPSASLVLQQEGVIPRWALFVIAIVLAFPLWFPIERIIRGEHTDGGHWGAAICVLFITEVPFLLILAPSSYWRVIFDANGVKVQTVPRLSGSVTTRWYPWRDVVAVRWVKVEGDEGFVYCVELELAEGNRVVVARYFELFFPERVANDLRRVCGDERVTVVTE